MQDFLIRLQDSPLAELIDSSRYFSMAIQAFHVLGFTFLLAFVVLFNLRLHNVVLGNQPFAGFMQSIRRPYNLSLFVALAAGVLLFLPRSVAYASNQALVWKLVLLVPAIILQYALQGRAQNIADGDRASLPLRAAAVLSLLVWFAVGMTGRAIGFV